VKTVAQTFRFAVYSLILEPICGGSEDYSYTGFHMGFEGLHYDLQVTEGPV